MKKLLSVFALLLVAGASSAQVTGVIINTHGGFDVVVEVGRGQTVTVMADGHVADINIDGPIEYNDPRHTIFEERQGTIKRVGNVEFEFLDRFTTLDQAYYGKIRRVGNVQFDYYRNSISSRGDRDGLLSSVGSTRLEYYDSFSSFDKGKSGLIESIGNIRFDFYSERDFFSAFDQEHRWKMGMLKSVDNARYDYFVVGSNRPNRPGSGHGSGAGYGQRRIRMSGPTTVRSGNVTVRIVESRRTPRGNAQ